MTSVAGHDADLENTRVSTLVQGRSSLVLQLPPLSARWRRIIRLRGVRARVQRTAKYGKPNFVPVSKHQVQSMGGAAMTDPRWPELIILEDPVYGKMSVYENEKWFDRIAKLHQNFGPHTPPSWRKRAWCWLRWRHRHPDGPIESMFCTYYTRRDLVSAIADEDLKALLPVPGERRGIVYSYSVCRRCHHKSEWGIKP